MTSVSPELPASGDFCDLGEAHVLMDLMLEANSLVDRDRRVEAAREINTLLTPEYERPALWHAASQRGSRTVDDQDEQVSVFLCHEDTNLTQDDIKAVTAAINEAKMREHLRIFKSSRFPSMKPRELVQSLKSVGCESSEGTNHTEIRNPATGGVTRIARHGRTLGPSIIGKCVRALGLTSEQLRHFA